MLLRGHVACILWLLAFAACKCSSNREHSPHALEPTEYDALEFYGVQGIARSYPVHLTSKHQSSGFHGVLSVDVCLSESIKLTVPEDEASSCLVHVLLIQHLPKILFVDPYELERPHWRKGISAYKIFGKVDLETPEVGAQPSTLALQQELPASQLINASFAFPLHIKYPAARPGPARAHWWQWFLAGYTHIEMPEPRVFIRGVGRGCTELAGGWARLQGEGQQQRVMLRAPVGNTDHYGVVSWVTTATSFLCCGAVAAGAWKWGSF